MRKVLIVDDEKLIRKGIRTILERSEFDFKDIKEATNGKEALDCLISEKFDLLIIDIRLPIIDGISVIKKIQNFNNKPKIIIISGYDEFNYAKECLQYGARAYLLKPIDKNEFFDVLKKINQEIVEEEKAHQILKIHEQLKNRFQEVELNNIFLSNLSHLEIKEKLQEIGLDPNKKIFLLTIAFGLNLAKEIELSLYDIKEELETALKGNYCSTIVASNINKNIVVITENFPDYHTILQSLRKIVQKGFYIGIYDDQVLFGELKDAYIKAITAAEYGFVTGNEIMLFSKIKNRESDNHCNKDELIKKLKDLILTGKKKDAVGCVESIFDSRLLTQCSISNIKEITTKIYDEIINYFYNYLPAKMFNSEKYEVLQSLFNFKCMDEYLSILKEFVCEISDIINSLKDILTIKDEIEEAIKYINENYYKDINMAMVANYISLNYYYFSTLFKERVGMSFLDYLNKVRIQRAKELLLSTNLKIWEIAQKVGYKNPKHFTRIFKELTGLSPNEYRDAQKRFEHN